jgi:prepilin-type N-terminal cleavage/methylation domain-containing protein
MTKQNNKGFTLVELAIVLVIIGLLVGGVLQGQELIRQAQIRNIMATVASLDASVNTFKAKYNQVPGDFTQADAFGINEINATANYAATSGTNGDGDGNGALEDDSGDTSIASGEILNFWVHLSNVGLVKGSFSQSALACTTACVTVAGTAFPSLPLGTGVIALSDGSNLNYVMGVASIATGATLDTDGTTGIFGDNLTPEEAFSLDGKLDDGNPSTGGTRNLDAYSTSAAFSYGTTPASGECSLTASTYDVATKTKVCTIRVRASS